MPSLGSILNIARSGLNASQQGINVTAHNIANAATEGYSRQRLSAEAAPPIRFPEGVYGSGVLIDDVQRIADPLLEASYRRELSSAGRHETRSDVLSRVEELFGEPSDQGLGSALDSFLSGWSALATNPTSAPVRSALRQAGTDLITRFDDLTSGLDDLRQQTEGRISSRVDRANAVLGEIASLNRDIVIAEADGHTAGDLRDARARRLDELAQLAPIQVSHRDDGSVGVTLGGLSIVDGAVFSSIEVRQSGGVFSLARTGAAGSLANPGGTLGGLIDVLNVDLPSARQALDDLAGALVTEVNALHETGTNPAGATGISFFDPTGTTASSLTLSADVLADLDAIAAGTPDGVGAYRAGANDIALSIAGLRDTTVPALGGTPVEAYESLVLDIGSRTRSELDAADVHRTLADQADARRMSLSGVSIDEELVRMIEFQTAYQAAARVISTADEMLQTLVSI